MLSRGQAFASRAASVHAKTKKDPTLACPPRQGRAVLWQRLLGAGGWVLSHDRNQCSRHSFLAGFTFADGSQRISSAPVTPPWFKQHLGTGRVNDFVAMESAPAQRASQPPVSNDYANPRSSASFSCPISLRRQVARRNPNVATCASLSGEIADPVSVIPSVAWN